MKSKGTEMKYKVILEGGHEIEVEDKEFKELMEAIQHASMGGSPLLEPLLITVTSSETGEHIQLESDNIAMILGDKNGADISMADGRVILVMESPHEIVTLCEKKPDIN